MWGGETDETDKEHFDKIFVDNSGRLSFLVASVNKQMQQYFSTAGNNTKRCHWTGFLRKTVPPSNHNRKGILSSHKWFCFLVCLVWNLSSDYGLAFARHWLYLLSFNLHWQRAHYRTLGISCKVSYSPPPRNNLVCNSCPIIFRN